MRAALCSRIAHSGGDPNASAQFARVILADPNTDVFHHLVKSYQGVPDKYVESYLWVKKCIERGQVSFTPLVYKNPGGRRAGEERTQFSEEDEIRLCRWIAEKIPYKETGGRTGNRLYMQLVEKAGDPDYIWVTRHTWQSWRERYKKNAARLDTIISHMVEERKPNLGEKGQYGYVRKPEEKPASRRRRRKESSVNIPHSDDEQLVQPIVSQSSAHVSHQTVAHIQPIHMAIPPDSIPHLPSMPHIYHSPPSSLPPPPPHILPSEVESLTTLGGGPMDPLPPSSAVHPSDISLERNGSTESDPEWSVKEGSHPQPAWAKRKYSDEQEEPNIKRRRTDAEVSIHVVDQSIQEIAREYRFTAEEVQEYYDKCGAMDRTRTRFKKMRVTLNQLDDTD